MTRHFFPGMMVLCWDFIDFNKTRLSAFAGWTTDDAKGEEEEEDNRVVNIKIAFFSVVLGGKRVVSCAFCRRARVICLLCSEEERERAFQCNTQDVPLTLATLNTRKRKREEFYLCRFWERHGETKDAKKESPPEKHPKTLLCTAVVVSFFVLLLFVRRLT